jgi:ABC-type phosphate transport system substrate-binding protein
MRRLPAILVASAIAALGASVSAEPRSAYEVIVNPGNSIATVDRQLLADAFLKKTTEWPDGETMKPVDLAPASPIRSRFSEEVIHRSVSEVKGYWQQRIFSGRDTPPPELDSDEEVVQYVLKHRGGVGYVSASAALGGARVVGVR